MTPSTMASAEVRAALARLGLTQSEAARVIGVNARTVRGWCAEPQRAPVPPWARFVFRLMERCDAWRNTPRTFENEPDHKHVTRP